ncbi:MAG: beta strand repeat-containing protein [Terriglobales bacterium]
MLTARSVGSVTNYSIAASTAFNRFGWGCTDPNTGIFTPQFTQPSFTLTPSGSTMTGGADGGATINPRYVVLALGYAQPGSKSSVNYGSSTQAGTSTEIDTSFSDATSISVTLGFGTDNNGIKIGSSSAVTQEKDTANTITVNKGASLNLSIPGVDPSGLSAPFDGINHDFDWVYLWLNPAIIVQQVAPNGLPNALQWSGYIFDPNDAPNGISEPEIVGPIYMTWLKNPSTMPPGTADRLARAWAGPNQGLNASDFQAILALDPFSNGSSNIDPTRFTLAGGQTFNYEPSFAGGNPSSETFPLTYQATSSQGVGASTTHAVGFSLSINGTFLEKFFKPSVTTSETLTWVDKSKLTTNASTSQSAGMTLVGPSAGYQGPTGVQLYQDNVYGTFMFAFIQSPTFNISSLPNARTVNQSASATYTISTTSVDGFASGVSFGPVTGLPSGATATFSPASLSGTPGSTVLTVTTSNTPAGTYSLDIPASSSIDTRNLTVTLIVNPPPDFSISASPSSQAVLPGGCTNYTVSTAALFGFTGSVALSQSPLPTGVTASFNPLSINGTGSSVYTACTSAATPAGSYTITLTGISGNLNHNIPVNLVVQDFAVSTVPASQTISAGSNATYTVSASALNGFSGTAALTVSSGLPSGASASFSPASVAAGSTSTLTVTTLSSTPGGTYTLTISGSSGGVAHTTTAGLTVNAVSGSVMISAPANNSNQSTSVRVTASATETGTQIAQMQVWDNTTGVRLGINNGSTIDQTYTLAPGTHQIIVEDLAAGTFAVIHTSSVTITVFADGVHITAPANNASITGPVHVTGFATESGTQIAQMQVWDNTTGVRLGINNGSTIDQTYTLASGTHQLIMEDLAAGTFAVIHTASVTVTVH